MPGANEQLRALNEARLETWNKAQELLDRAVDEKRGMSAEEKSSYDKMTDDLNRFDETIERISSAEATKRDLEKVNEAFRSAVTPDERDDWDRRNRVEEAEIRSLLRPPGATSMQESLRAVNSMDFDLHDIAAKYEAIRQGIAVPELRLVATDTGSSGGSLTVPTTMASTVYAFITNSVAMRRLSRILTTSGGGPMGFPRVTTHGVATQVANQNTTLAGTDPALGLMTLNAYDYAQLIAVSNDMLEDSGVDVLGYIAEQLGRAIGQIIGTAYVTGNGTTQPMGIATANPTGGAGTIATGGSLIMGPAGNEASKLIDLQYSISDGYVGQKSWLFNRLTVASLRKMRDGAGGTTGAFLWQPSPAVGLIPGEPDRFLGDPVYSDPNVASMASDAKIGFYGDFSRFYIRDVGTFRVERSDDIYFDKNQVAFRGIWRTDSDLIDATAINTLHQAVT